MVEPPLHLIFNPKTEIARLVRCGGECVLFVSSCAAEFDPLELDINRRGSETPKVSRETVYHLSPELTESHRFTTFSRTRPSLLQHLYPVHHQRHKKTSVAFRVSSDVEEELYGAGRLSTFNATEVDEVASPFVVFSWASTWRYDANTQLDNCGVVVCRAASCSTTRTRTDCSVWSEPFTSPRGDCDSVVNSRKTCGRLEAYPKSPSAMESYPAVCFGG